MRSSRISPEYIASVKNAVKKTYSKQQDLSNELAISLSTLSNFLNGRPVDHKTFIDICERLNLDWKKAIETTQELPEDIFLEYRKRYIDHYGKIKLTLSGMREAISLGQIYTNVRFLKRLSIRQFTSIEDLEKEFREQTRRFQIQERIVQDGIMVANEHPLLMVLGAPGSGKSTYLRQVGLEALKGEKSQFRHKCIPVMLELKRFARGQIDIKAAIVEEFHHIGLDFAADFVETTLQQGQFLILLDGLDEVPHPNRDQVFQEIQDFVSQYTHKDRSNRFIVSCRIAAYKSGLTRFTDIEIADFDDDQISQFIKNWFHSELDQNNKTAEKFWDLLNDVNYTSAKELAQTPLLLAVLCVVYDRTQSLPRNRAFMYRKALDILLEEWAAEKRIHYEPIYEGLNTELEKVLLAEIAYQGFVEYRLFFTQEELIGHVKKFLEDYSVERPKYLDGKAVLDAIAMQQSILIERAVGIYSFSHLTVQEYLTAQYLSQSPTILTETLTQHVMERRWREVFLLVPGLLPKGDHLLQQMALIAQQRIDLPKLQALMAWADRVTIDSANPAPSSSKRTVVVFYSLCLARDLALVLNLARDFALARDFTPDLYLSHDLVLCRTHDFTLAFALDLSFNLSFTLSHDLDLNLTLSRDLDRFEVFNDSVTLSNLVQELEALKPQIPDHSQPLKVRNAFADRLLQVWCDGLKLDRELVNLSDLELQALADYFYICELIVRCKESAVRVSREVWESIENAMVMPIPDNDG